MTPLLWDVHAAIQTLLTDAVDVPVYDAAALVAGDAQAFVLVGEADPDNGETATSEITPSPLGNDWYDEAGTVSCSVIVWTGATSVAEARSTAKDLLTACTEALAADPTLGGLLLNRGQADVTSAQLRESQSDTGLSIDAAFTVSFAALLT